MMRGYSFTINNGFLGTCLLSVLLVLNLAGFAQRLEPPASYGQLPSEDQVQWQKLGYYMFIHFGPNTFTDREWGDGKEDPQVFNPSDLDARQWARTAKLAGMKAIIITAKHHDGFCLWPSKYSTHTVRESPWKNGQGDVLKELSEACREYGLKFGVYLSPWDQNHPSYGTPEYNEVFAKTLEEVLTQYGEIFEVWFDGANGEGPNGKKQVYDWPLFRSVVYKHQPQAIIFSDIGPGARWIGNESGFAGETNWSTLNTAGFGLGVDAPKPEVLNTGNENGEHWIPGEADVSIRPGWFYSPNTDDKVKTLSQLMKIYHYSIGRNANLLLNIPINRQGLVHPNDSTRLMEFRRAVETNFQTNLARGKQVTASNTYLPPVYSADKLTDEDEDTYWVAGETQASLTLNLGKEESINRLLLQEYIPLGQRVREFTVEYWNGEEFIPLTTQTTIGYKRILTFPTLVTQKIRVHLTGNAAPVIGEVKVYFAPEVLPTPVLFRDASGLVHIEGEQEGQFITYTLDGSDPGRGDSVYRKAFEFKSSVLVKARAFSLVDNGFSDVAVEEFDLLNNDWEIKQASIALDNTSPSMAIDGENASSWISKKEKNKNPFLEVDMGAIALVKGFTYTPPVDARRSRTVFRYRFSLSEDGKNWTPAIEEGSFGNIKNNPSKQRVLLKNPISARFFKFEAVSVVGETEQLIEISEIGILN